MPQALDNGHDLVVLRWRGYDHNAAPCRKLVDHPPAGCVIAGRCRHDGLFVKGGRGRAEKGMKAQDGPFVRPGHCIHRCLLDAGDIGQYGALREKGGDVLNGLPRYIDGYRNHGKVDAVAKLFCHGPVVFVQDPYFVAGLRKTRCKVTAHFAVPAYDKHGRTGANAFSGHSSGLFDPGAAHDHPVEFFHEIRIQVFGHCVAAPRGNQVLFPGRVVDRQIVFLFDRDNPVDLVLACGKQRYDLMVNGIDVFAKFVKLLLVIVVLGHIL